jgi:hypothetical protein
LKKLSLSALLCCVFVTLVPLVSQDTDPVPPPVFKPLVFKEVPGAYAIYRDTRFGETAYVGLCAVGGNELALRMYVPSTQSELLVMQTFYTVENPSGSGGLDIEPGTIDLIRGDFSADDATKRLLPLVYNWMNAWLHSRSRFEEMPEYAFDEDGMYLFQYWIPVLQMKDADISPDAAAGGVTLVTAGVAESGTDPAFFEYRGEAKVVAGPAFALKAGEERMVDIAGLSAPLDSNWISGEDGVYRIPGKTGRDAYFMAEVLDTEQFGDSDTFDMIKLFLLYSGGTLLPEGLRIFSFDDNPCLFYRLYDPGTGQVTVQYKMFLPRDGKSITVLSLGAFESIFTANRDFFESILF